MVMGALNCRARLGTASAKAINERNMVTFAFTLKVQRKNNKQLCFSCVLDD